MKNRQRIGADVRTDVNWTKWGWQIARHFRGAGDGHQGRYEDKPYKTVRRFIFWRFLRQLEKEISIPDGSLHLGLKYSILLLAFFVSGKLTQAGINALQAPLISAAITLDGSVTSSDASDTVSVTVAANSNRVMYVSWGTYQGGAASGCTQAGNAMTKVKEQLGSFSEACQMWGIVAPTTGTNNVVISGAGNYRGMSIYSLYDCDQTLATGTDAVANTGDSSSASVSITPSVDNCWIIDSLEMEAVPTMTTSSGVSDAVQEGASYEHVAASHFVQTTAAAKTMSYSGSYGSRWNICAAAVKPATGGATGQPRIKRGALVPHIPPLHRGVFGAKIS